MIPSIRTRTVGTFGKGDVSSPYQFGGIEECMRVYISKRKFSCQSLKVSYGDNPMVDEPHLQVGPSLSCTKCRHTWRREAYISHSLNRFGDSKELC